VRELLNEPYFMANSRRPRSSQNRTPTTSPTKSSHNKMRSRCRSEEVADMAKG
jgi:hypothetical protein